MSETMPQQGPKLSRVLKVLRGRRAGAPTALLEFEDFVIFKIMNELFRCKHPLDLNVILLA